MIFLEKAVAITPSFQTLQRQARLRLLRMHYESGVGHIGGNLSALDALLVLHHQAMGAQDQCVLSKGHGAGALYVALWSAGKLSEQDLASFHRDDTLLAGHPPANKIAEIPFATGSLGHGLGLAAGLALGKRKQNQPGRVFCLMSDGEWQEGSNWEALIFACHHRLNTLTVMVDVNGIQGFGATQEVASMDLERLAGILKGFALDLVVVDGHDAQALMQAVSPVARDRPCVILMRTCKGKGVGFMENTVDWHYLALDADNYAKAVAQIEAAP